MITHYFIIVPPNALLESASAMRGGGYQCVGTSQVSIRVQMLFDVGFKFLFVRMLCGKLFHKVTPLITDFGRHIYALHKRAYFLK